ARIEQLVAVCPCNADAFAFTGVNFYDSVLDEVIPHERGDERTAWYKSALQWASLMPTAGFGLLCGSITVTTSNFFFSRSLFERLRGFKNRLRLAHDWDFALRATLITEPRFVANQLVTYRFHDFNTFAALR